MGSNTVRVEFTLTMSKIRSWDGKWSYGEGKNFIVGKKLSPEKVNDLFKGADEASWTYSWDDGWSACVTARILTMGKRSKPSDGFAGYEWMVDSIINHGRIKYERT